MHTPTTINALSTAASRKSILTSSSLVALSVYFLLAVFQPFGTYNFSDPFKYLLLIPYALFAFLAFSAADLWRVKSSRSWSLKREAIRLLCVLAICSVVNYGYSAVFVNRTDFTLGGLTYMVLFTFVLGVPVSMMYLQGKYVSLKQLAALPAAAVPEKSETHEPAGLLTIKPLAGMCLTIPAHHFVFAESEGNYTNLFFLESGALKKQLLRISLKQLESQVCGDDVVRCHRSFIVNTRKIVRAKGNAQGYQLSLEHTDIIVPVSRPYIGLVQSISR